MVPVNYLAVLCSAVVMMVLGGLWYGPLFGKQWMALMGIDPEKGQGMQAGGMQGVWKSYALMALGALIMSFVLSHALVFASTYLNISGLSADFRQDSGIGSVLSHLPPSGWSSGRASRGSCGSSLPATTSWRC